MTHLPDPDRQSQFYADVPGKRLLAWVIDAVIIGILTAVIVPFTAFTALFFLPFLLFVVSLGYRIITIAGGSATFGMRIAAIELRNRDGMRLNFAEAALHTIGYHLTLGTVVVQIVSVIFMCASPRGQSLTDMVLGTAMLNRRSR
ncbi:RDD family protein [Ascidiaceihabitans sp.]|uniref:RDD family protein n=1 Tax=Ascidiaceihabitans sp. TaxID=1872644 RepID=UPI003296BFBC